MSVGIGYPLLFPLAKIEVLVHCIVGRGFCWRLLLDALGCLTGVGWVDLQLFMVLS